MGALVAVLLAAAPAPAQLSHRRVQAADGAALALYRYGPVPDGATRPPVLLLPDLGFSRLVFDLYGEGLARWLAARGFLVYVGEVRGQGRAEAGSLEAIATLDVPALVAAVQRDGPGPVDLVVQGYEGTLALAAARAPQVRRVVAINTPVAAEVPSRLVEQFLGEGGRFSDLASSREGALAFELMFAMGARFPPHTLEALRLRAAKDLAAPAAASLLAWMRTGDLPLGDGTTVASRLKGYDRPTLQLLALADGFSSPELCSTLREVSSAKVTLATFSRFENSEDYSHLSMLLGASAPREVFPRIERFLLAEDPP